MTGLGGPSIEESEDLVAFCRRIYPSLLGTLSLYVGERGLAEELVQDALTRLCRDWRRVRSMEHPEAWTHRVAINFANSYLRRRAAEARARGRLGALRAESQEVHDTATDVAVRHAVSCLPKRQKEALILRYYADLTFAEVAETMGSPIGTVKSLTQRALERLRRSGLDDLQEVLDVT
jgi:RNA polymerase sigma-70 factor (sigma-E family)